MAAGKSRLAGAALGPREGHMTRLAAHAAGAGKEWGVRGVVSHVPSTAASSDFPESVQRPDGLLLPLPLRSVASMARSCAVWCNEP